MFYFNTTVWEQKKKKKYIDEIESIRYASCNMMVWVHFTGLWLIVQQYKDGDGLDIDSRVVLAVDAAGAPATDGRFWLNVGAAIGFVVGAGVVDGSDEILTHTDEKIINFSRKIQIKMMMTNTTST